MPLFFLLSLFKSKISIAIAVKIKYFKYIQLKSVAVKKINNNKIKNTKYILRM